MAYLVGPLGLVLALQDIHTHMIKSLHARGLEEWKGAEILPRTATNVYTFH